MVTSYLPFYVLECFKTYLEFEKVGLGNNSLSIALDVNKVLILLNADIAFASNPAKSDAVP